MDFTLAKNSLLRCPTQRADNQYDDSFPTVMNNVGGYQQVLVSSHRSSEWSSQKVEHQVPVWSCTLSRSFWKYKTPSAWIVTRCRTHSWESPNKNQTPPSESVRYRFTQRVVSNQWHTVLTYSQQTRPSGLQDSKFTIEHVATVPLREVQLHRVYYTWCYTTAVLYLKGKVLIRLLYPTHYSN